MESIENTAIKEPKNLRGVFTTGEVMAAFGANLLDERACREWIIDKLHRGNKYCPDCGEDISKNHLPSFWEGKRIRCWSCGKWFTALTGTFLSGCHFDFCEVVMLAHMLALGVDDKQIASRLKITAESVRLWRLKFRELEKVK